MKKTLFLAIFLLTNIISYYLGSHYFVYMAADVDNNGRISVMYPHGFSLKDAYLAEREYANALMEGLHRWYSNDDNDIWFEGFMKTREYQKIDSLNHGDWEDFYYYETPQLQEYCY